jgi:hypothetical protein
MIPGTGMLRGMRGGRWLKGEEKVRLVRSGGLLSSTDAVALHLTQGNVEQHSDFFFGSLDSHTRCNELAKKVPGRLAPEAVGALSVLG